MTDNQNGDGGRRRLPSRGIGAKKVGYRPLSRKIIGWVDDHYKNRSEFCRLIPMDGGQFSRLFAKDIGEPTFTTLASISKLTGMSIEALADDSITSWKDAITASGRGPIQATSDTTVVYLDGIPSERMAVIAKWVNTLVTQGWEWKEILQLLMSARELGSTRSLSVLLNAILDGANKSESKG